MLFHKKWLVQIPVKIIAVCAGQNEPNAGAECFCIVYVLPDLSNVHFTPQIIQQYNILNSNVALYWKSGMWVLAGIT